MYLSVWARANVWVYVCMCVCVYLCKATKRMVGQESYVIPLFSSVLDVKCRVNEVIWSFVSFVRHPCYMRTLHFIFFCLLLFNAFDTISLNIFSSMLLSSSLLRRRRWRRLGLRNDIICKIETSKLNRLLEILCSKNLNTNCIFNFKVAEKWDFFIAVEHTNRISDQWSPYGF